jgi:hypothetical protein
MPKSRRRKRSKSLVLKIPPAAMEILGLQREAFRKKFGRDPGPGDPLFFDPDATEPTLMSEVRVEAEVLAAMRKAGLPEAFAYAYKKTGLMGFGDTSAWPAGRVKEWNDAVKEYELIERASKEVDRPDEAEWATKIPELLASPFSTQDLEKVHEILRAVAEIERREPIKVVTRIELAAAFVVAACECAYDSAEATGSPGEAPNLYAKAEEIVLRRARDIYAQGSAGSGSD